MKTIVLLLLNFYQAIVSPLVHQLLGQRNICRYETNCSTYAKDAILKHGVFIGSTMALKRFVSCQPFTSSYANI